MDRRDGDATGDPGIAWRPQRSQGVRDAALATRPTARSEASQARRSATRPTGWQARRNQACGRRPRRPVTAAPARCGSLGAVPWAAEPGRVSALLATQRPGGLRQAAPGRATLRRRGRGLAVRPRPGRLAGILGRVTRQAAGRRRLGWGPGDGQAARGRRARGPAGRVPLDLGRPRPLVRLAVTPGTGPGSTGGWPAGNGHSAAGATAAALDGWPSTPVRRPGGAGPAGRGHAAALGGRMALGQVVVMLPSGSRAAPAARDAGPGSGRPAPGRIPAERAAAGLRPGPSTGGGDWPERPSARRRGRRTPSAPPPGRPRPPRRARRRRPSRRCRGTR